ncbi:diiron oxygenase [Myxococcus virescens]|uniref:diiron oxygenase n=1 Tax=Myxococcus virescens TaxID=83456 RepID=UPI003DA551EE
MKEPACTVEQTTAPLETTPRQASISRSLEYRDRWEARGSIRTRPRKPIDFAKEGHFFPTEKQPLLLNEVASSLGQDSRNTLLLHSFFKYLNDIINLEVKFIVSACEKLIDGKLPLNYPDNLKLNAYTVIIDEYYHVYVAKDMILQLRNQHPEFKELDYPLSDSYRSVIETKALLDEKYHDVFEILAVCIFETTLVRELVEFFNSDNIHPSIKYYINDHMNDESRHYGFFLDLMKYTWENLPEEYRAAIGTHIAFFVKRYLNIESDKAYNAQLLGHLTGTSQATEQVAVLYKGFDITPDIPIVKNVLTALKNSGVANHASVRTSFNAIGWQV